MTHKDYESLGSIFKDMQPIFNALGSSNAYVRVVEKAAATLDAANPDLNIDVFTGCIWKENNDNKGSK